MADESEIRGPFARVRRYDENGITIPCIHCGHALADHRRYYDQGNAAAGTERPTRLECSNDACPCGKPVGWQKPVHKEQARSVRQPEPLPDPVPAGEVSLEEITHYLFDGLGTKKGNVCHDQQVAAQRAYHSERDAFAAGVGADGNETEPDEIRPAPPGADVARTFEIVEAGPSRDPRDLGGQPGGAGDTGVRGGAGAVPGQEPITQVLWLSEEE